MCTWSLAVCVSLYVCYGLCVCVYIYIYIYRELKQPSHPDSGLRKLIIPRVFSSGGVFVFVFAVRLHLMFSLLCVCFSPEESFCTDVGIIECSTIITIVIIVKIVTIITIITITTIITAMIIIISSSSSSVI